MEVPLLLNLVGAINKRHTQIAGITGEGFNIFQILKVGTNEVRMHSAFLAEMLDPNGSHGQRGVFLHEFVKYFNVESFFGTDFNKSRVRAEKHINNINEEYTEGGRIDIIIESETNKVIVIENKIYAGEQSNWLIRYKNRYPTSKLLYLTLTGVSPSEEHIGNYKEGLDFENISYSNDIIKWLEVCREKAVMQPLLRECISQYINLIKHLTHQSLSKIQKMEIQKLLLDTEENFQSAQMIASAIGQIKNVVSTFQDTLLNSWINKYSVREINLFSFNNIEFQVKPSFEDHYFHFDLNPLPMGTANNPEFKVLRNMAKQFEMRDSDFFWSNTNYIVWVRSKIDLVNLRYDDYKRLHTNLNEWIDSAMKEGEAFISFLIDELQKLNNPGIIINPKFIT